MNLSCSRADGIEYLDLAEDRKVKNYLSSAPSALVLTLSLVVIVGAAERALRNKGAESSRKAAELYAKSCASCHGKDGRAKSFKGKLAHARNLADPEWQGNVTDERIFNSITGGKRKMPAFGKKLSDAEIDSLVGYVRGLRQ